MFNFPRMFSTDSAKAIKADKYGYLNGINYAAQHTSAGVGNMCPDASPGCISLCLGKYSGQASMVADLENGTNNVRESRKRKTQFMMKDMQGYLQECCEHIERMQIKADKLGKKLCIRMNGSTDIAFERIKIKARGGVNIFKAFPDVQFVDYTKVSSRFKPSLPNNLHLTFSRSEINEAECFAMLAKGYNVAVVFGDTFPADYLGAKVYSGDNHDLRHLDPKGGNIIALTPKGHKAKRDTSGFVVRNAA